MKTLKTEKDGWERFVDFASECGAVIYMMDKKGTDFSMLFDNCLCYNSYGERLLLHTGVSVSDYIDRCYIKSEVDIIISDEDFNDMLDGARDDS